jgi:hypothetical protein
VVFYATLWEMDIPRTGADEYPQLHLIMNERKNLTMETPWDLTHSHPTTWAVGQEEKLTQALRRELRLYIQDVRSIAGTQPFLHVISQIAQYVNTATLRPYISHRLSKLDATVRYNLIAAVAAAYPTMYVQPKDPLNVDTKDSIAFNTVATFLPHDTPSTQLLAQYISIFMRVTFHRPVPTELNEVLERTLTTLTQAQDYALFMCEQKDLHNGLYASVKYREVVSTVFNLAQPRVASLIFEYIACELLRMYTDVDPTTSVSQATSHSLLNTTHFQCSDEKALALTKRVNGIINYLQRTVVFTGTVTICWQSPTEERTKDAIVVGYHCNNVVCKHVETLATAFDISTETAAAAAASPVIAPTTTAAASASAFAPAPAPTLGMLSMPISEMRSLVNEFHKDGPFRFMSDGVDLKTPINSVKLAAQLFLSFEPEICVHLLKSSLASTSKSLLTTIGVTNNSIKEQMQVYLRAFATYAHWAETFAALRRLTHIPSQNTDTQNTTVTKPTGEIKSEKDGKETKVQKNKKLSQVYEDEPDQILRFRTIHTTLVAMARTSSRIRLTALLSGVAQWRSMRHLFLSVDYQKDIAFKWMNYTLGSKPEKSCPTLTTTVVGMLLQLEDNSNRSLLIHPMTSTTTMNTMEFYENDHRVALGRFMSYHQNTRRISTDFHRQVVAMLRAFVDINPKYKGVGWATHGNCILPTIEPDTSTSFTSLLSSALPLYTHTPEFRYRIAPYVPNNLYYTGFTIYNEIDEALSAGEGVDPASHIDVVPPSILINGSILNECTALQTIVRPSAHPMIQDLGCVMWQHQYLLHFLSNVRLMVS